MQHAEYCFTEEAWEESLKLAITVVHCKVSIQPRITSRALHAFADTATHETNIYFVLLLQISAFSRYIEYNLKPECRACESFERYTTF